MSILSFLPIIGDVLDRVIPDPAAAAAAKIKLIELEQNGQFRELEAKAGIIKAEASSEHWLTAVWRPVVMLVFTGLIVARWFGYSAPGISEAEVLHLWDIVELGIGGYVIGRSVEKVAPVVADAIKGGKR